MATTRFPSEPRYDDSPEFQQEEGVLIENPDTGTLALLNRTEIDQQISTAKKFPRSIKQFRNESLEMVTLTEQIAGECIYALPRDGKTIEGPSARFAEVILSAWGNARAGARTVSEDAEFVTAQGAFYDLQRNVAISYEVKRRITDRNGRRYKPDMIGVTANAACSVALRNAILKGIPKAFWSDIYNAARSTVAGDIKTLANRRTDAMKAFQIYGVKPEYIFNTLGVKGIEDITIEHLVTLKGILTAIKDGDTTPEQAFAPQGNGAGEAAKSVNDQKLNDLKDKYVNKSAATPAEGPTNPLTGSEATSAESPAPPSRSHRQRSRHTDSEDGQQEFGAGDEKF